MIKWPWRKRVEDEMRKRAEAERRRRSIVKDGRELEKHAREVAREVTLNDWTMTAKRVFSGRD